MTNKILLQIRKVTPMIGLTYIILFCLMFFVTIIAFYMNISVDAFTRDPAALFDFHPFLGLISNIGILFWCSTSAICLFSANFYEKGRQRIVKQFLITSGLLTLLLLLDDLFMLHDEIFPMYFHGSEKIVYCVYIVLILMYFLKFKTLIAETEYFILFMACSFLGFSIIGDVFFTQLGILVEDGSKLFGIVTWFIYFARTCFFQINSQKITQG